jgi:hypothetical protein
MMLVVTRTRTVITVFTLVSVLALGACSDDDPEPKFAPTPSTSAPTSPSTTAASGPTEPTMPAVANGTDAASAEAFVTFYWEMVNYAEQTGDLAAVKRLSSDDCVACRSGLKYLEGVFTDGGEIKGGDQTVSHPSTSFANNDGVQEATVQFDLTSTRQTVDYPSDADDKVFDAGTISLLAVLARSGNGWRMIYWGEQ